MSIHKIVSRLIYPMSYKFFYSASWSNTKKLEKSQWLKGEDLKEMQFEKIRKLINHAYNNVKFYKDLFDKNNLHPSNIKDFDDFQKLPIISKNDFIRFNLEDCTAKNIEKKRIMYQSTSGSTGTPFKYAADKNELGFRHLIQFRSYNWAGWRLGDRYVYFDGMIGGDGFKPLIYKLYLAYTNYLTRRWHIFSAEVNTDDGMQKTLEKLAKYKPVMIRTTVSQIRLIMHFVKRTGTFFPKVPLVTVGETLTKKDREDVRNILDCEIFESYGAGEFCGAYECEKHEGLHVSEEDVYLEIIKDGKPARPGEAGRVVITNLHNYVWPFIRYDMGDVAVLTDKTCSCGRHQTLIKEVMGRVSEFVVTKSNKLLGLHDFTQIIGHLTDYIKQWQVVQTKKGQITLNLVPNGKLTDNDEAKILDIVNKSANNDLDVILKFMPEIPKGVSDKNILVKSSVNKDF